MSSPSAVPPIRVAACDAVTGFGDAATSLDQLLAGRTALRPHPVLGNDGGDPVPLALLPGRAYADTSPPAWLSDVRALLANLPAGDWGTPRRPVMVTSSNFGVGNMYAYQRHGDASHLAYGTPSAAVDWLTGELGWGPNVTTFSHACVSAHLGLLHAARLLHAGLADAVLAFSFDFLSPFVTGGFHALKILNAALPAPYAARETGSIGLGDGAAWAILTRDQGDFIISHQSLYNEMHHFTANEPGGSGFAACLREVHAGAGARRVWLKGHGTGTLEAGRLEAEAFAALWRDAPLVSWKGGLGHTLGSCGLVELAIALRAMRNGRAPGTVGSAAPGFTSAVAFDPVDLSTSDAAVCASNAFGGAHAAFLLSHA